MTDKLILAVPSKGRLKEQVEDYFRNAGIPIAKDGSARGYTGGRLKSVANVDVVFMQAGEIPAALEAGDIHLGVTGQDLLHEKLADPDLVLQQILSLGFGYAKLVVAVPKSWIDVDTLADLDDVAAQMHANDAKRLRVATKYLNATRKFFAAQGISDYRIVESLGATEGAPNSGAAEIIVDITTTGSTLEANDLKILSDGVMLESYACLAGSFKRNWGPSARRALRHILDMIGARADAEGRKAIRFNGDPLAFAEIADELTDGLGCTLGSSIAASGNANAYVVYGPHKKLYAITHILQEAGFQDIVAFDVDYIFADPNPLYQRFTDALD